MSVSLLNTAMASAQASLAADDYTSAIKYATQALGYLAAIPDSRHQGGEMRWRGPDIERFITRIEKLQASSIGMGNSSGMMQVQKVVYENSTDTSGY